MKLAVNRYNVKVTYLPTGKSRYPFYYGYTTRKEAEQLAEIWNKTPDHKAVVTDRKKK